MKKGLTYAKSGVDIFKEEKAIKKLIQNIKFKRRDFGKPLDGHYAGLIEFGEHILALCTDGVGSKLMIASEMKKWDTVGIDCIAMNVNDAICVGAEPIAFVDYIAIDKPDPHILEEIGKGLSKGAEMANISIVGGETATLPDIVNGFDLAGTCLAYTKKNNLILGDKIRPGDIIIGLKSSGLHSNGYTLVRKVLEKNKLSYHDKFPNGIYPNKKIGEILLTPTKIYVKEILECIKKLDVHGLAHITGGGLRNLLRLNKNVKFVLDNPFDAPDIFKFIQDLAEIDPKEMYQTFNMGMGFVIILPLKERDHALEILSNYSEVKVVGYIERGKGVHLPTLDISYIV
ncbi:MAG: phosphoribosylformylglycinamidine cyclo-ligase [Spirochaetes bacterium]|nr:MAG: phosphoribosylformylglycinamidine cyclo-ligase [Spirochaetota bacterium]